jgi:hypothetical protein
VAGEEDARWLLERMQASPTKAAVEAVGWSGLVEAIPALLRLLAARTGELARFDPHDFVLEQERSLKAWEAVVRGAREAPGGWGPPGRG